MDLVLNTTFNNPKLPRLKVPGFLDDFDRANADTLGQTLDGEQWTIFNASTSTSVWGTTGNGTATMKFASFGYHLAVADALTGDGEFSCVLSSVGAGTDARFGLAVRVIDVDNYITVAPGSSTDPRLRIQKRVAGTVSNVGAISETSFTDGDTIKIIPSGDLITVLINGVQIFSETVPEHTSATQHGIFAFLNTTAEWGSAEFTPAEA